MRDIVVNFAWDFLHRFHIFALMPCVGMFFTPFVNVFRGTTFLLCQLDIRVIKVISPIFSKRRNFYIPFANFTKIRLAASEWNTVNSIGLKYLTPCFLLGISLLWYCIWVRNPFSITTFPVPSSTFTRTIFYFFSNLCQRLIKLIQRFCKFFLRCFSTKRTVRKFLV